MNINAVSAVSAISDLFLICLPFVLLSAISAKTVNTPPLNHNCYDVSHKFLKIFSLKMFERFVLICFELVMI